MDRLDKLQKFLEKSSIYYKACDGNRLEVCYGKYSALAEPVDSDGVRLTMRTGIHATPQTEDCIRAVAGYLEGWKYKIANFALDGDEVVLFYEREIEGPESAAEMLRRIEYTVDDCKDCLEKAAQGQSPQEATGTSSVDFLSEMLRSLTSPEDAELGGIDSILAQIADAEA